MAALTLYNCQKNFFALLCFMSDQPYAESQASVESSQEQQQQKHQQQPQQPQQPRQQQQPQQRLSSIPEAPKVSTRFTEGQVLDKTPSKEVVTWLKNQEAYVKKLQPNEMMAYYQTRLFADEQLPVC